MAVHCGKKSVPSNDNRYYSSQSQSPLFRKIPAEIRQEIYIYYTFNKDGYFHDFDTDKLLLSDHQPIKLDLMYTCKAIHEEMTSIPLQTNKVTFASGDYHAESNFYKDLRSKAARFKFLLRRITTAQRQMLLWAKGCVTSTMLDQIAVAYGSEGQFLADAFTTIRDNGDDLYPGDRFVDDGAKLLGKWNREDDVDSAVKFQQALQHLLQLAANRPDFRTLASQAFDIEANSSRDWTTLFVRQAYSKVLGWAYTPWTIPSDAELASWESLFLKVPHPGPLLCFDAEEWALPFKWYFSAAAVAIGFIDRYQLGSQLRRINLIENRISVSNPECHMEAFASFYRDTPMPRICRSISVLEGVFPRAWGDLHLYMPRDDPFRDPEDEEYETRDPLDVLPESLLLSLVPWLDEANAISSHLPSKSFELEFIGTPEDTLISLDLIKHVAMLQDAHLDYFRRRNISPPLPSQTPNFRRAAYPLPCHLPTCFLQVVKGMISGTRPEVRFQGSTGEMWDLDAMMSEREHWTPLDWKIEWQKFMKKRITLVGAGMKTRVSTYLVDQSS